MSRKIIIWIIILFAALVGVWYALREYSRTNKDLADSKPDFNISVAALIQEYESNDSLANSKYNGKILEVKGNVKAIETDQENSYTVVLGDSTGLSSVRCLLDSTHQEHAASLAQGSSVVLRGACTGFNKDEMGLGSDVVLNRCVILDKKE